MTAGAAGPGWHPDPADPWSTLRWWDGSSWTGHTQPKPAPRPVGVAQVPPRVLAGRTGTSGWDRNRTTLTVLGVVAGYLALAAATGIVLLGIFPVMMSLTAVRRREPFAFAAVIAAAVSVVVALGALTH